MPAATIEEQFHSYNAFKSMTLRYFVHVAQLGEKEKLQAIQQTAFAIKTYNQREERIELKPEVLSDLIRESQLFTEQALANPDLIQKILKIFPYTPAASPTIASPAATLAPLPITTPEKPTEKNYTTPLQQLVNQAKRSGKGTWLFKTPEQKIKSEAELQLKVQTKAEFKSIIDFMKNSDTLTNPSTALDNKIRQSKLKDFEKNIDKNVDLFIKNHPNSTDPKLQRDFILREIQLDQTKSLKTEMEGKLNNAENPHRQSIKELEDYLKNLENKKVFLSNKTEKKVLAENVLQAIDLDSRGHTPLKSSDIEDYIRQNKKHNFYFKREDRLDDILHNIGNELSHRPSSPKTITKPK